MVYYNLKLYVLLKKDIQFLKSYNLLSDYIALAMLKDSNLKALHEKNEYKLYNFCSLYPAEKDGIYKKGKIYCFDIKFVNKDFILKMKQLLNITETDMFKVINSSIQVNRYRKINKLISLTPCILTTDKGDYNINNDIHLVKKRMLASAEKKYNQIYSEEIHADYIKNIKKINIKPMKIPYKNIYFLGNKFEVEVKDDERSQKLAYIALSTGMLEKNSQGFGFCKAH